MQEIIINKNEMATYKTFYEFMYKELDVASIDGWEELQNFNYNTNLLYEILWDKQDDDFRFILIGFDIDHIKAQKTHDDYRWNIILTTLEDFTKEFPNNTIEYR